MLLLVARPLVVVARPLVAVVVVVVACRLVVVVAPPLVVVVVAPPRPVVVVAPLGPPPLIALLLAVFTSKDTFLAFLFCGSFVEVLTLLKILSISSEERELSEENELFFFSICFCCFIFCSSKSSCSESPGESIESTEMSSPKAACA